MALGTIFTLLVIPSIYVLLAKQHSGEQPGAIGQDFAPDQNPEEDLAGEQTLDPQPANESGWRFRTARSGPVGEDCSN
jgi:hypothetical protein